MASGRLAAALIAAAALVSPVAPAFGTFLSAPSSPSMSVTTATLAAPASSSATNGTCVPAVSRIVDVSWAQTTSAFADGYVVFRATASGGPYSSIATIGSVLTIVYADSGVAASTTYYYRIQATKLSWRSADSPTASATTPSLICL